MSIFERFDFSTLLLIVLAAVAVKAAVLAMCIWFGTKLTGAKSATTSHQVTKFVLWSMLLMPFLVFCVPALPLPDLPATSQVEPVAMASSSSESATPELIISTTNLTEPFNANASVPTTSVPSLVPPNPATNKSASHAAESSFFSVTQILAIAYLIVAAILLIRTLLGWLQCLRLVKSSTQVKLPDELHSDYPVLSSSRISVPATIGIVRPKILLPADWSQWDESDVAMAIAHESSHIQRRDTLTTLLAATNCALYWFHPLSWMLKTRLAELAEHACDDAVISQSGARGDYAKCLLRMASRLSGPSEKKISLGVGMARTALVEQRVDQIMDRDRKLSSRRGYIASILTLASVAIAAAFTAAVGGFSVSDEGEPVPDGAISGIVLKPDGSPAVGAEVYLHSFNPTHRTYSKTNQKGRFVFTDFPAGVHRVVVTIE